jgi:MtN3 and saliva related transmembrane protein
MSFAVVGYIAGTLTTLSFVPQVARALRTRKTDDISWGWLSIFQCGLMLWFAYGVMLRNWPMILANAVTMSLCGVLIGLKARSPKPAIELAHAEAAAD